MSTISRISNSRSAPKKSAVVIDLGSAFIKCGFAGEPRPTQVIPSVVGGTERGPPNRTRREWIDVFTDFFSRLYTETLQCRPRDRRVILCESMVCPRELREAIGHVLFCYLQVPAVHLCPGPAPALYCTGLDTGIILDIGTREAHVIAVYRGMSIVNSYAAIPLGCHAVQNRVREMIAEDEAGVDGEGVTDGSTADERGEGARGQGDGGEVKQSGGEVPSGGRRRPLTRRELEEVTVQACFVPVGGVPSVDQVSPMEWAFSGKRQVTASTMVRTCAAEQALFEGDGEGRTLATLVLDSLKRCPRDCRAALVQNILVAGGGALIPGLCARLCEEIRALAQVDSSAGSKSDPAVSVGDPDGYAWASAVVSGSEIGDESCENVGDANVASGGGGGGGGGAKELRVARALVPRDLLLWTGASIMGCLAGVAERSLTSEQYLARGGRMPDWMSVSPSDWLFSAPLSAIRSSAGVSQ